MRPEDFSPGNPQHRGPDARLGCLHVASMRPEDFSPGNTTAPGSSRPRPTSCFNEAGGFLPRKRRVEWTDEGRELLLQ